MRRTLFCGSVGLACVALLTATVSAKALMVAPSPIQLRVAQADAVVVGKVTTIEDKTITALAPYVGATNKVEYQIAVIEIKDGVAGVKGLTHVKVGFVPQPVGVDPVVPPGGLRPPIRRYPSFVLTKDQEVMLFLKKHPTESFHVGANYFDVVDKKTPTFEKDVDLAKKVAKLLDDPIKGLQAKDADDRLTTAAMLLYRYRTQTTPQAKTEPIDAEQSKLILTALAEADWNKRDPQAYQMNPQSLFYMLRLTPQDGWTAPKVAAQIPVEAKKWLQENAGKYRIQRFVAATPEKK